MNGQELSSEKGLQKLEIVTILKNIRIQSSSNG